MTAQIPDRIRIDGVVHDLVGDHGTGLWRASDAGVPVLMASTNLGRGYLCTYGLVGDRLVLDELDARIGSWDEELDRLVRVPFPVLHGRDAQAPPAASRDMFNASYRELAAPVPFTGELLAGDGLLPEADATVDALPWGYARVTRLRCHDGLVTYRDDLTSAVATVRAALTGADPARARRALEQAQLAWLVPRFPGG
jgi:hypothetical protein